MKITTWLTLIFIGIIVITTMAQPNPARVQSWSYTSIDVACSTRAVPMPQAPNLTTLGQCQSAVRAYVKAIVANVRVTATCREEFAQRVGQNSPSAATVRNSSRELVKMIPELERGAEQQLKSKVTLADCKQQLSSAQQLVRMQPELRGDWATELRK